MIVADGLDSVSLRRVAGTLGVTAPALYAYVEDKRDLLRGVAEQAFSTLIARFETIAVDDPIERIDAYSRAYVGFALDNPELFRTMFLFPPALAVSEPTGEELPAATRSFELPRLAIAEAMDQGRLRAQDPDEAALTVWTATHGLADVLLLGFGFDDGSRRRLVDQVLDTVLTGLGAVAGAVVRPDGGRAGGQGRSGTPAK